MPRSRVNAACNLAPSALAEVRSPLGLDFGHGSRGEGLGGGAALCDVDQAGTCIAEDGGPAHVPGSLELIDQEPGRLLDDLCRRVGR